MKNKSQIINASHRCKLNEERYIGTINLNIGFTAVMEYNMAAAANLLYIQHSFNRKICTKDRQTVLSSLLRSQRIAFLSLSVHSLPLANPLALSFECNSWRRSTCKASPFSSSASQKYRACYTTVLGLVGMVVFVLSMVIWCLQLFDVMLRIHWNSKHLLLRCNSHILAKRAVDWSDERSLN